ncbi:hypothetical protein VTK73DRAFT_2881 [Phialemonium thermophilum]|uniref:beta-glucosidase n=1 Tax=Phialemonium thermophilum TaxID=223376 RepID=A0ABR3VNP9_9PEZI
MSVGPGQLYIDGELALDLWDWTEEGEAMFDGSIDYLVEVPMRAHEPVELRVKMTNELRPVAKQKQFNMTHKYGGCRIGFREEDQIDYLREAVEAARAADVAVVVVGLDAEWESEGYDRQTMDLPSDGSQDRLIEAVAAANPRTVVVNQSGSPVRMPWADRVPAIVQAWYQGQEAGNALADVLFGLRNPSGKLPVSSLSSLRVFHLWVLASLVSFSFPRSSSEDAEYPSDTDQLRSAHSPAGSRTRPRTTTGPARTARCSTAKGCTSDTGTTTAPRWPPSSRSATASRTRRSSTGGRRSARAC